MKILFLCIFTFICILGFPAKKKNPPKNTFLDEIRIVPVERTPEPDNARVEITFPGRYQVVGEPVKVQLHVESFTVGTNSDFERQKEIRRDRNGESIHVIIDELPYFTITNYMFNSMDQNELYFVETLMAQVPYGLDSGMHVIRVFPCRTFGESLKGKKCFDARIFYVGSTDNGNFDLKKPYLTYNEPQGDFNYDPETPILLDFWITNAKLSRDGYKVRLSIDGQVQGLLPTWTPYYIYGLTQGTHSIRLELLDSSNTKVPGPFNDVEKTISLN